MSDSVGSEAVPSAVSVPTKPARRALIDTSSELSDDGEPTDFSDKTKEPQKAANGTVELVLKQTLGLVCLG